MFFFLICGWGRSPKVYTEIISDAKAELSLLEEKGVCSIVEETELKELLKDGTHILGSSNAVREKYNEDGNVYKLKCRAVKQEFREVEK